jgi:hypothetical protein
MGQNNVIPNFANVNLFKVNRNESFTVPDTVQQASPSGISSGLSPANLFDSKRNSVGGAVYAAFSDAAGPTSEDFQLHLNPGDVVAVSNAAPAVVSVNGVTVFSIVNTAVAGVLGYHS